MARKQQFLECPKPPKTLREALKIITGLWNLVQQLRETVERLQANSQNSSIPPSQDRLSGKAKREHHRKPSDKKRGAQPGHVRHTRKWCLNPRSIKSSAISRIPAAPAVASSFSMWSPRIAIKSLIFRRSVTPSPNTNASVEPAPVAIAPSLRNFQGKLPPVKWVPA